MAVPEGAPRGLGGGAGMACLRSLEVERGGEGVTCFEGEAPCFCSLGKGGGRVSLLNQDSYQVMRSFRLRLEEGTALALRWSGAAIDKTLSLTPLQLGFLETFLNQALTSGFPNPSQHCPVLARIPSHPRYLIKFLTLHRFPGDP